MFYFALFGKNASDDYIKAMLSDIGNIALKVPIIAIDYCMSTCWHISPIIGLADEEMDEITDDLLRGTLKAVPIDYLTVKEVQNYY